MAPAANNATALGTATHTTAPMPSDVPSGVLRASGSIVLKPRPAPSRPGTSCKATAMTTPAAIEPQEIRRMDAERVPEGLPVFG